MTLIIKYFSVLLLLLPIVRLAEVTHNFTLHYGNIAPDNYLQQAILINNQFPGPTIHVRPNDTLIIHVTNHLDHGTTIHFHGIHQKGTQRSDGVPHVTQELIATNGSYRYEMRIGSQHGTYVYHAHNMFDLNWMFGLLIIDDSHLRQAHTDYSYDDERHIIISQCWHTSIKQIYNGIMGSPFVDMPDTDSILINGRSYGVWSGGSNHSERRGYEVINVEPNRTYRFRVIGFGDDSMVTFSIADHNMTIIEVDGSFVDPVVVNHLEINTGQRYSVLVRTHRTPNNYLIKSELIPGPGPDNGVAILHYTGVAEPESLIRSLRTGQTEEKELTEWVSNQLHPSTRITDSLVYKVPTHYDHEIIIRSMQKEIDGYTRFAVNDIVFKDPDVNFLTQIERGIAINHSGVYRIREGETVQIVFQNQFSSKGECEQHPWHMHGHTFYVVGHGSDAYNSSSANDTINANIANNMVQFRDVLTLYPNRSDSDESEGTACGWVAIRFVANNPGVWLAHCHLTAHMLMGKLFVLYESAKNDDSVLGDNILTSLITFLSQLFILKYPFI